MEIRRCETCTYARRPTGRLLRIALHDFPGLLICFRCAESDGEMNGVSPGGTCRNYRHKLKPRATVAKPRRRRKHAGIASKKRKEWRIPLSRNLYALVDRKDLKQLSKYKWTASGQKPHVYAMRRENGRTIYMHRLIMNAPKGRIVDHINCNSLDNRRENLRICTWRQNQVNKCSRRGASRFVGVWRQGDRWVAEIRCRRKRYSLGSYSDEVEAAKARDRKAWELHGEFAYLNFPEDFGF